MVISDVQTENEFIKLQLLDGRQINVAVPTRTETLETAKPDRVKNYFHHSLEVCTVFSLFTHLTKVPQREKMLPLFKMMMLILRGRSTRAKYPLEIFRLLVQQYSLLPLADAYQVLYDCFVNTRGKPDSHVPADQQMEWLVKVMKKHIKHMHSQNTQDHINTRSSALPGITEIADQLDLTAQVLVRCSRHNKIDPSDGREQMVKDFASVNPFTFSEDRKFKNEKFSNMKKSNIAKLDYGKLERWFNHHKVLFEP